MTGLRPLLACLAVVGIGCDADPAEERLRVTLGDGGGSVVVDAICEETCAGDDQLTVRLDYPDKQYLDDEIVELVQYKVDYNFLGLSKDIPFFAGTLGVNLAPGGGATLRVVIAGSAQREVVREFLDDEPSRRGTATLTLAGYDWDNKQVFLESDFDLVFGDLAADTGLLDTSGMAGMGGSE